MANPDIITWQGKYLLYFRGQGESRHDQIAVKKLEILLFQPTDHERLDQYMGLAGDHHVTTAQETPVTLTDGALAEFTLYEDAKGGLKENVEFDKKVFAAYANSLITTSYSKDLSLPGERLGFVAVHPQAADLQAVRAFRYPGRAGRSG